MSTGISWADETLNPWRVRLRSNPEVTGTVCVKIADGCMNCYASELSESRRWNVGTGLAYTAPNLALVEPYFDYAIARKALAGRAARAIFWGSMTDAFGDWQDPGGAFAAIDIAQLTPHHQHIFLTKRPERMALFAPEFGVPPVNVWFGCSVAKQSDWDAAAPHMVWLAEMGWNTWVSYEPATGPVDFDYSGEEWPHRSTLDSRPGLGLGRIIIGGESGTKAKARPFDIGWARDVINQGAGTDCRVFVKQLGRNPVGIAFHPRHPHGSNPAEWPADLRPYACTPQMWISTEGPNR